MANAHYPMLKSIDCGFACSSYKVFVHFHCRLFRYEIALKCVAKTDFECTERLQKCYFPKKQCISSLLLKLAPFQTAEDYETIQHGNLTYKQQKRIALGPAAQLKCVNLQTCAVYLSREMAHSTTVSQMISLKRVRVYRAAST